LDCACARCRAKSGSSASQTGFQYCAVDSITASWTARCRSHAANATSSLVVAPKRRRSKCNSASLTSATTTIKTLLCTSIPAIV
jgi:hypothetical protein